MPNITCKKHNYGETGKTRFTKDNNETIILHLDVSIMSPIPEVSHSWWCFICEDSESRVSKKIWHRFTYTLITYNTLAVLMRGWVWMIMVTIFSVHLQKGIFFLTKTFHVWENADFHSMRYNLLTSVSLSLRKALSG